MGSQNKEAREKKDGYTSKGTEGNTIET